MVKRYRGGIMSATQPDTTTNSGGMWNTVEQQQLLSPAGVASLAASAGSSGPVITNVIYTDASFVNTSANAASNSGGNIKVIGTGFQTGSNLYLSGNLISSNTFVSSTEYRATLPATTVGTYTFNLFAPSNAGSNWVPGIQFQVAPVWTSYTVQATSTLVSSQLAATGAVSYAVTGGSLPGGLSLSSSGLLSGTFTGSASTPETFSVTATTAYGITTTQLVSFTYSPTYTVQYLVVAGGGAGGLGSVGLAGGGGAGGLLAGSATLSASQSYTITVGAGGAGSSTPSYNIASNPGSNSSIVGVVTTQGGGGGGFYNSTASPAAQLPANGGSGGGAAGHEPAAGGFISGGLGYDYPGPTQQGYPGGSAGAAVPYDSAGGGGAGGAGTPATGSPGAGGPGGVGKTWTYTGPATYYAGGGGGGTYSVNYASSTGGAGGGGAGGQGYPAGDGAGQAGTTSTGGGGGGSGGYNQPSIRGGAGGSGVIKIAVPTPAYPGSAPGATVSTPPAAPGMTVLTYTSSGTYTA